VTGTDSKKIKTEGATAFVCDLVGGSHDAFIITAKIEQSEYISLPPGPTLVTASAPPPPTFTPPTLALRPDALRLGPPSAQSDDLFDALDLDIAPAGTPIEHLIPNSILPHPDVRNKFSDCYRVLVEKHMVHLNGTPRHMIVWSFSIQAKYAPVHVLFKYILEMKPLTVYVATPPETRSNNSLPTHLHKFVLRRLSTSRKNAVSSFGTMLLERARLLRTSTPVFQTTSNPPLLSRIP